jgi:hypothetical protein
MGRLPPHSVALARGPTTAHQLPALKPAPTPKVVPLRSLGRDRE